MRLKKKTFRKYAGIVYDLTVSPSHTYNVEGIVVHNSGAGSLLNYCLRITLIDPLEYDLLFERFLNPDRISPPDIDWDTAERDRIISYIEERYGPNRVCKVGSLNFLRTKSAIRDVGRVLNKPKEFTNELVGLVPPPIAGLWDSFAHECEVSPRLKDEKYADVISVVDKLWSLTRSYGTHASGIAIAPTYLTDFVPLYRGTDGKAISQFDWRDLEKAGLLKFDILGLSTLQVIQLCLEYLRRDGIDVDLDSIQDGDAATYELIRRGDLDGIFQLGGSESIKQLTVSMSPKSIKDLSLISALFRPGPLASGMVSSVVEARAGKREVVYQHPILGTILSETCGVPVYQEQVMRICTDLCGYSPSEADEMRKIMGKKLKDKMVVQQPKFVSGAEKSGMSHEVAAKLFDSLKDYAQYLFNASHSAAYAVISYWTGYLKAHYPVHFYTALLSFENSEDKIIQYINSAKESNISILRPDVNLSDVKHKPEGSNIRFGLGHIKGMPTSVAEEIVRTRESLRG